MDNEKSTINATGTVTPIGNTNTTGTASRTDVHNTIDKAADKVQPAADKAELVAQHVEKRRIGSGGDAAPLPVYFQFGHPSTM